MRNLFLMLALAGGALVGCSDDDPPAVDGAVATLTQDCPTYCSNIATVCSGANAQITEPNCLGTCAKFPLGAATDTAGVNSLGCRLYHIQNISVRAGDAATHCPHAGPGGAKVDAASGTCGDACTSFCEIETKSCGTTAAPLTGIQANYASVAACVTACATFDKSVPYTAGSTPAGNTLACRLYHATNAAVSATAAMTHCKHTGSPATAICI